MCLSSVVQSLDWLACFSLLFPCAWRKKRGAAAGGGGGIRTEKKGKEGELKDGGGRKWTSEDKIRTEKKRKELRRVQE